MPNILIIGFQTRKARSIRKKVETIVERLNSSYDAVTTIISAETKWCGKPITAPYLLVRNTKLARAKEIATEIHKELNLDVEYEKIHGFLAKDSLQPALR